MCRAVLGLVIALLASACGGSTTAPTPPPPAGPTLTGIRITGPTAIRTSFFQNYTAALTYSDGSTQGINPTWATTGAAATVDSAGRVVGVAHGSTVLSASAQGVSTSLTIAVVQNYGGQWSGTYQILSCDQSGGFAQARWCQTANGQRGPFTLNLGQFGSSMSQIGGQIAIGQIAGEVSGSVTPDGRLNLGGTYTYTNSGTTVQVTIGGWDTRATSGDSMTGGWAQNYVLANVAGNAYQQQTIVSVTHLTPQ